MLRLCFAIVCDHMETGQVTISIFLLGQQVQPSINYDQLKQQQINLKEKRKNIMCSLRTPRPICRSTSRPTDRSPVDRHIDRCSTAMSVDISTDSRPMCRSRCVGRRVDRHIGRCVDRYVGRYVDRHISIDISAVCRSTCRSIGYRHSADTSLLLAYW